MQVDMRARGRFKWILCIGALLVINVGLTAPIGLAAGLTAIAALLAYRLSRGDPEWTRHP